MLTGRLLLLYLSLLGMLPTTLSHSIDYQREDRVLPDRGQESLVRHKVRYGAVKISNFSMQTAFDKGKVVYAAPGDLISAFTEYKIDRGVDLTINQIIIGYDKLGAQTAIYDGLSMNKGFTHFELFAPQEPGIYEVRFRGAQAYTGEDAINGWWLIDGEPSEQATIGLVIVDEAYGKEEIQRPIQEKNLDEYLAAKYGDHVKSPLNISVQPLLNNSLLNRDNFWGIREGKWRVNTSMVAAAATSEWNRFYAIQSQEAYANVDLFLEAQYRVTSSNRNVWSFARGYGVMYYVNDQCNLQFHYFPDVEMASLYIRDDQKVVEYIKRVKLSEFHPAQHHIKIDDGKIFWSINGIILFEGKQTTLKAGQLRLINYNNDTTFHF